MRASDCRRLVGKLRRSNASHPLDKKPTLRRMANKKLLTLIYWNSSRRLCVAFFNLD